MGDGLRRATGPIKVKNSGLKRIVTLSSEQWLKSYTDDFLIKSRTPRIDPGWFHPSSLSHPCDRKLAFEFLGIPRTELGTTAQLMRIFQNGDMVHRRWQAYFRVMGILVKREAKFEVGSPPIRGSADAIIRHPVTDEKSIVEIKSINEKGFLKLTAPWPSHFNQLNIYMGGHGIFNGLVLYENKNDQSVKVYPVKHDATKWEQIQFRLLKIVRLLQKEEMPKPYIHDGCIKCPFYGICGEFQLKDHVNGI